MCALGKEIKRTKVEEREAIIGYRGWYVNSPFSTEEKVLKSLSNNFLWKKGEAIAGNIDEILNEIPLGIYSYDKYYEYYNYNYDYDNYDKYYNYNNYNNYDDYNYNYNCNYYIAGKCLQFGDIVKHEFGYRSSMARVHSLVVLDDPRWFEGKTREFSKHFNEMVENLAEGYHVPVIEYSEYSK